MYTEKDIEAVVSRQRAFFRSGATLPTEFRIRQLKALRKAIKENEQAMEQALRDDLGRTEVEAYFSDIGPVIAEINEALRNLRRWSRPELHFSGLACFPSIFTRVYRIPYGVTLIISPFNFPFMLSFGVLLAAIAAGNTAVIKASSKSVHCTAVLKRIVSETFPEEYVTVIDGGHDTADMCLDQRFDKIFYTGSPQVAKHVMAKAAVNLTPVALELGGENGNWCVVRKDADLKDAAGKIAFFKLLNSGQVCININQVAVAREVADEFLAELKKAFSSRIGENALENGEYPHLIGADAYDKCERTAEAYRDRIIYGGSGDRGTLRFQPTLIYPVDPGEEIVRRELFSPLLPVVPFDDEKAEELLDMIDGREHPLAFYLFTKDMKWARGVMRRMQYGGGCINEVCVHMMAKGVPFCGTGHSGMGAYHGRWGFNEFSHPQTVLTGSTRFNLPLREHPYTGEAGKRKMSLIKMFLN
jgi:aldehyde dehydrogenase (NAD+)